MKLKSILFSLMLFAAASFAQETEGYADVQPGTEKSVNNETEFKRHSISVGYGILTISDFVGIVGSAIISIFGEEDSFGILGAVSIDYGYKVNEIFETGLVFNYSMPIKDESLYTIMPRAKLNFNVNGFVNPFMELDAGVAFNGNGAAPMFHATLLGLELGKTLPLTLNLLSFGQRGIFYASLGCKF